MTFAFDFYQPPLAPSLPPSLCHIPGRGCCVAKTRKKALSSTASEVEEGREGRSEWWLINIESNVILQLSHFPSLPPSFLPGDLLKGPSRTSASLSFDAYPLPFQFSPLPPSLPSSLPPSLPHFNQATFSRVPRARRPPCLLMLTLSSSSPHPFLPSSFPPFYQATFSRASLALRPPCLLMPTPSSSNPHPSLPPSFPPFYQATFSRVPLALRPPCHLMPTPFSSLYVFPWFGIGCR